MFIAEFVTFVDIYYHVECPISTFIEIEWSIDIYYYFQDVFFVIGEHISVCLKYQIELMQQSRFNTKKEQKIYQSWLKSLFGQYFLSTSC